MTDAEFSLCVDKNIKMVYRIAFHYFGKHEDAEDITQEVFTKLYSSKISRENEDELKAWLQLIFKSPKNAKQKCRKTPNENAEKCQTDIERWEYWCNNVM